MAAKKKTQAPKVKVGRWLVVTKVDSKAGIATCRVHREDRGMVLDTGRLTSISVERFVPTSTGYELVDRVGGFAKGD